MKRCIKCIERTEHFPSETIYSWRYQFRNAISKCDIVITPTRYVRDVILKYYDLDEKRFMVIGHGHKTELLNKDGDGVYNGERPLNIAYIGVMAVHKGSNVFFKMACLPEFKDKIRWSVIGECDGPKIIDDVIGSNIKFFGVYEDYSHLKRIIKENHIDVIFLPAIWPETFSYTLSEAWSTGLPTIVSGLGALKERVGETSAGWVVDVYDIESIKRTLVGILQSPEDYMIKKKAVIAIKLKPLEVVKEEYIMLYNHLINCSRCSYIAQFVIPNSEIYRYLNTTEMAADNTVDKNKDLRLDERLIKCYMENGLSYTIKCIPIYILEKLHG
jgi:glycosyltransferase involved in cell wall biosynthesis